MSEVEQIEETESMEPSESAEQNNDQASEQAGEQFDDNDIDVAADIVVNAEIKNIIEAALLVAGGPLSLNKMLALFPEDSQPDREEIKAALVSIEEDYTDRGIELKQIERGWRIQSREKYVNWLSRLTEEKPPRYSRAALETLAIIAYRQPVTRGDIEEIRGVSVSSEIIRQLQERDWVRQVGQRDVPGKPSLYGTTRGFLEYFNLKSLSELPTLAELRDLDDISRELNLPLGLGSRDAEAATELPGEAEAESESMETVTDEPAMDDETREAAVVAATEAEVTDETTESGSVEQP
ncbi:MAG: SMC-Scp complex subunit ScpB [Gammaproteobacteria bacterium]|nr:SMC-Scp complex subunit ScpB [Gammaproteobacteria bacterium]